MNEATIQIISKPVGFFADIKSQLNKYGLGKELDLRGVPQHQFILHTGSNGEMTGYRFGPSYTGYDNAADILFRDIHLVKMPYNKNHPDWDDFYYELPYSIIAKGSDNYIEEKISKVSELGSLLESNPRDYKLLCAGHDVRVEGSSPSWADIERSIS